MADLRTRAARDDDFPPVLFVHLGTVDEGEAFFAGRWPEAPAIADPDKVLYGAFGLARGSVNWVMGPRVWGPGLRSLLTGHVPGRPVGDPLQRSGAFLVRDGAIVWEHRAEHSGAAPRWDDVPSVAAGS